MRIKRPHVKSQTLAVALGLAGFGLGWAFLYDAFEGRRQDTPKVLRPFTWW
jgi:hypothetical protein